MNENISQWFAREFLGEKYERSVSRVISDNTGMSINAVHFFMALGVIAYLGSRK